MTELKPSTLEHIETLREAEPEVRSALVQLLTDIAVITDEPRALEWVNAVAKELRR